MERMSSWSTSATTGSTMGRNLSNSTMATNYSPYLPGDEPTTATDHPNYGTTHEGMPNGGLYGEEPRSGPSVQSKLCQPFSPK